MPEARSPAVTPLSLMQTPTLSRGSLPAADTGDLLICHPSMLIRQHPFFKWVFLTTGVIHLD